MDSKARTVLFLSSSSGPGGAERVLSKLAMSLDRKRYRPIVGLFRPGWLQEQCEGHGVETRILPHPGYFDLSGVYKCFRLVRQEGVALIHSHEFDANVHGAMVARLSGIPQVATVHGKNYYWERSRRRVAYRLVARRAHMVAVSEDLKQFIVDRVGISAERIDTIYNGVEIFPDVEETSVEQLTRELGINRDEQIVGTVGSLYPVKGQRYLLEALPRILEVRPRTRLLIIGRGELEASLKAEAKRLGVERNVLFLGLRQDIQNLLAIMDVFVLPSLSEGLSIALLEAMAARRPIVATNVGGNPELVQPGETGYLSAPQDSKGLAAYVLTLLSNGELARRFGENGRKRVEKHFSLTAMTDRYQSLYASLAS